MFSTARYRTSLIALPLLLAACSTSTSVSRHASHLAYQTAQADFDPNVQTQVANTAKNATQFLQIFYQAGKRDREAGLTPVQAKERADSLNDPRIIPLEGHKYTLINREYSADNQQKIRSIAVNAAMATYMDGYNGIP